MGFCQLSSPQLWLILTAQVMELASLRAHGFCGGGEDAVSKKSVNRYLVCQMRKTEFYLPSFLVIVHSPNFYQNCQTYGKFQEYKNEHLVGKAKILPLPC